MNYRYREKQSPSNRRSKKTDYTFEDIKFNEFNVKVVFKSRSSRSQMFFEMGVLKINLTSFTGKHLCWSLLIKLQNTNVFL